MLLARELIAYISRELVKKLTPIAIETHNPQAVAEIVYNVITEELAVEDRLNDEVRESSSSTATTCAGKASVTRRCSAKSRTP